MDQTEGRQCASQRLREDQKVFRADDDDNDDDDDDDDDEEEEEEEDEQRETNTYAYHNKYGFRGSVRIIQD